MSELQTERHKDPENQSNSGASHSPQIVTKGNRLTENVMLREDTPEFKERCAALMEEICAKYAWTAQQQGFVLRRNPLKQPPLKDYVFARIARSEYGFHLGGVLNVRFGSLTDICSATNRSRPLYSQ